MVGEMFRHGKSFHSFTTSRLRGTVAMWGEGLFTGNNGVNGAENFIDLRSPTAIYVEVLSFHNLFEQPRCYAHK